MIKRVESKERIQLDLIGEKANIFYAVKVCKNLASELGIEWQYIQEAIECDGYAEAIITLDEHFGYYVDFNVPQEVFDEINKIEEQL